MTVQKTTINVPVNFRIDKDLHDKAKEFAFKNGMKVAGVYQMALMSYLKEHADVNARRESIS